jgi:hypothetical protein
MAEPRTTLTNNDFLALVSEERRQSIGFDNDDELNANREMALNYAKGEMPDVPSLKGRSGAVSTDFADAVETLMPDLMEILCGGEDVVTFRPIGEEDVEGAQQETDYVNHLVMNENAGWRVLYAHVKDALQTKLGITKVWPEYDDVVEEENYTDLSEMEVQIISQAEGVELEVTGQTADEAGNPLYDVTIRRTRQKGRTCIMEVPPEDFTFARDTVTLAKTTYCAMRTRPRAQQLIADGHDADKVGELTPYGTLRDGGVETARDNAGENDNALAVSQTSHNLHQVEIVEHIILVDADGDGRPELWRVLTGNDEAVLLKKERVDEVPFAVSTPFIVTHRLLGQSLYDKVGEVQRIKTALLRIMLDSGYFAMNQRSEVAMDRANDFTLSDLLNYVPGAPIRSATGDAVRPISAGQLGFDVFGAMEYVSVMGEQRSGVVRNAQGLNPDTLHETAKGALAMISQAQKRVRMIARVFAETGVKDLFLLVHAVTRKHPSMAEKVRLRGNWTEVDPSTWGSRKDMTVEVGVGSGGREQQLVALDRIMGVQEKLVAEQGGFDGPFVTKQNIYDTVRKLALASGEKSVDPFFTDPAKAQAAPQTEPPPDPAIETAKIKAEADIRIAEIKAASDAASKDKQMEGEFKLKRYQIEVEARMQALGIGSGSQQVEFGGQPG